jgi:hypothetical protein
MSALILPPLPGEPLHPLKTVTAEHERTEQAGRKAIAEGRITAFNLAGRWFVTETERQKLLRHGWPSKNPGVSRFWEDWRAYRRQRATVQPMEAA